MRRIRPEMDEHMRSMVHHRELENLKGRTSEFCHINREAEGDDRRLRRRQNDRLSYQDRDCYETTSRRHHGPSQRDWNWGKDSFLNSKQGKFIHSSRNSTNSNRHLSSQRERLGWHQNGSRGPPSRYHNYGSTGGIWHQNDRGATSGWHHHDRGRNSNWSSEANNVFSSWQSKNVGGHWKSAQQNGNGWNIGRNKAVNSSSQVDNMDASWLKINSVQDKYSSENYTWQWQESVENELQQSYSFQKSQSSTSGDAQSDGKEEQKIEDFSFDLKVHEVETKRVENKNHDNKPGSINISSDSYSSYGLAELDHIAAKNDNCLDELSGANKKHIELQKETPDSLSNYPCELDIELKTTLAEDGDEDVTKSNDALEKEDDGDNSNHELLKGTTGPSTGPLLPELSKLGFPASLQRDLTWRTSLKNKTSAHLPKPNLNNARRIRNVSGHRKNETEKESGLKPTLRQIISASRRNVNWEQVIQQVSKKKQEQGKGLPRFGIEMVPLIQNEQEGLELDENVDLTSLEGFQWEEISIGSPGTVRKRSLSESSVAVDEIASIYSFFNNQGTSKEDKLIKSGSVANSEDITSRIQMLDDTVVTVKQESSSLPSSPFKSDRTDLISSERKLSLQSTPNVAIFSTSENQRSPDYTVHPSETKGTLESAEEHSTLFSGLADISALNAATDSSYTSSSEQNDSQGMGKKRRATGEGSCPEIPSLERKTKRRKIKGKKGALFDMATKKKRRNAEDDNREFKVEWTETFAFVENLDGLPTCLICQKKLAHNRKSNLERHFTTKHMSFSTKYPVGDARKKAVEELQKRQEKSSSVFNNWMQSSSNVNIASFVVSQEIAKRGKLYTDGEYIKNCFINASKELFRDFKNKADILKKIKELPLSAKTVRDRTVKMSLNITNQQVEDLKLVSALSIAVDESCDINDTAQVSLFVRFISSTGPKEELLGLLPLKGQTRGEDIANAVIECIEKHHITLNKIVSISTDGAKSMTGIRNGFVAILKKKINHEVLTYHCIIHQEALCAQTFPEEICKVMELVIKIINSIIAKGLNHRQFKEFLVGMESEYADLLLHNKVRWLSRGNILKRFASLLTEIKAFLLEKGIHYPELTNDQWIQKFYFMVDVTSHLNQLNHKLQGKGNTIFSMLEEVMSFENKLALFAQDFERGTLIHFPSLLKHRQENNSDIDICYFKTTLLNMREAFLNRFQEFRSNKATLAFVKNPLNATVTELNFSPFNIDIGNFEMQLLDLKNKELWSSKFERLCAKMEILERKKSELSSQHKWSALKHLGKEDMLIFNTWNSIPDSYNQLKKLAFSVLSLFGSTYLCEQSFSSMNLIKSKLRNRLIDENLESCLKLKITTYKPDLPKLSKEMQGHCSH